MIDSIYIFGARVSIYYLCWFLAVSTGIVLGCWSGKKLGISLSRSILYSAGAVMSGVAILKLTTPIFDGEFFAAITFILPLPMCLLALLFHDPCRKVLDQVSPLVGFIHAGAHIGCHGYPSSWGIFSNVAGRVCFHNVPIEVAVLYILSAVICYMLHKGYQRGSLYAWYLVMFGSTRFFLEFLRDNEKIWCGISKLAFLALASVVVGMVMLATTKWICKRSPHYEESKI